MADCVEEDLVDFLDVFFVGLGILYENLIYLVGEVVREVDRAKRVGKGTGEELGPD